MSTIMATLSKCFGDRVRDRRNKLGWSQVELARRLQTTQSRVSDIENGEVSPTLTTVEKLATILGVPAKSLLS